MLNSLCIMFDAFLSIAVSFIGYSVRNISQACQKIGLTLWSKSRLKGGAIWILGTLGTTGSLLIMVIAGLAGCLMGFVTHFQKVSISEIGRESALFPVDSGFVRVASNPYTLIWIFLSTAALIILQFAYKRDRAIRLIPAFTANYLFIPVVGGIISFGERLHPLQWVGVVLILIGVIVITSRMDRALGKVGAFREKDLG